MHVRASSPVRLAAVAAALATAAVPVAAQAQAGACVTESEVSSLALYATPHAIRGVRSRCGAQLSPQGWLQSRSATMTQRYAALGTEAWPRAKRALLIFATSKTSGTPEAREMSELVTQLPDEAVRPMIDAVIQQKVAEGVKPSSCRSVERVLEVVSRLDPRDATALLGVVLSMVDLKEPKICPAEGA